MTWSLSAEDPACPSKSKAAFTSPLARERARIAEVLGRERENRREKSRWGGGGGIAMKTGGK